MTEDFFSELCRLVDGGIDTETASQSTGNLATLCLGQTDEQAMIMLREVGSDVNGGLDSEQDRQALARQLLQATPNTACYDNLKHTTALGKVAKLVIVDGQWSFCQHTGVHLHHFCMFTCFV